VDAAKIMDSVDAAKKTIGVVKLTAGIYNVLSSCGKRDLMVKMFLENIDKSDISTEASLLTIFQSQNNFGSLLGKVSHYFWKE